MNIPPVTVKHPVRVLILGVAGMLGNAAFRVFSQDSAYETYGTLRNAATLSHFKGESRGRLLSGIDVLDIDALLGVISRVQPDVVINCVGLIKQLANADDPLVVLPINAMLPHRLERICLLVGARLIHISTDCVFSGSRGDYKETDISDANDLYGKSKYIGELDGLQHAVTLRTSIIGHELRSSYALINWFLSQRGSVKGYSKAIFSGLPTVELARVVKDFVLPCRELSGLYHVAAQPIAKADLLHLVARQYGRDIEIVPDDTVVIDRSLNSERFQVATAYTAPLWSQLIKLMHMDYEQGCLAGVYR